MRILVTGATGYIGSNLVKSLVKENKYEIAVVKRPKSDISVLNSVSGYISVYDLDKTSDAIYVIISHEKPKIVVHLASLFLSNHNQKQISPLIESNITFPTKLLDAMATYGVRRFLNTGTSWEYFNGSRDYDPVCLYAGTKRAFEDILKFYIQSASIKSVTLKLFDTYGPNDPRPKLFYFLKKCLVDEQPIDFSPGEQTLDLLHIDDVVSAYEKALIYLAKKESQEHNIFFIGLGKERRLKDVVGIFEEIIGKKLNINWGGRPYRQREVMRAQADISQAKEKLGWHPHISLREGIRKMLKEEGLYD